MRVKDLGKEIVNEINEKTSWYGIGIFPGEEEQLDQIENFAASGTLVSIGQKAGILTAAHVIHGLKKSSRLGLALGTQQIRYTIPTEQITFLTIGDPPFPPLGPDMGMIVLPKPEIGKIKAKKSFFPLEKIRDLLLQDPPSPTLGVWAIVGIPAELSKREMAVVSFQHISIITSYPEIIEENGFDFFDFEIPLSLLSNQAISFGGMSGGGVWHICLREGKGGKVEIDSKKTSYYLSGVIIRQFPKKPGIRKIRCHGRKSIYLEFFKTMSL